MAINSQHPFYQHFIEAWRKMRDTHAGQAVVKERGVKYLKPTPGQILDGMEIGKLGFKNYEAYKERAVFHDYVQEAVKSYIGLLHCKPAIVDVPDRMKPMLEKMTNMGEDVQAFLRRINEQQLITGRLGLLLDLALNPDPASPMPYVTMYVAEACINWDDSNDQIGANSLGLVVLNETSPERRANFEWVVEEKYRVLMLVRSDNPNPQQTEGIQPTEADEARIEGQTATYMSGVFYTKNAQDFNPAMLKPPMLRGQTLEEIPFVFVNSKDVVSTPDTPPLEGLADICLTMYRGEADYRQTLFMQGQDTLVVIGGLVQNPNSDEAVRVGAGSRLDVNTDGDAKYIGTSSSGIPEQRMALEGDHSRAIKKSMILASSTSRNGGGEQRASGDALRVRMAAQTATLTTIALAGAEALETLLKAAARWMGEDDSKVSVKPNLQFADFDIDGKEFVDLMTARTMGAPFSLQSIHALAAERGLTDMTFEEETDAITEEDAGRAAAQKKLGIGPTGLPLPDPNAPPANDPNAPPGRGKAPAAA